MDKKFIIDVIPLTRIPLTRQQYFSYEYSQKLPVGTLVSIPLFHRFLNGIVINSRNDFHRLGNIKLKKINKVLEEKFLTERQLELAKFISDYYFSPLGVVLKFFIPRQTKPKKKHNVLSIKHNISSKIRLSKEQLGVVKEITKNNTLYKIHDTKYLLFSPASSGKTEVYIHSIKEIINKNPDAQFLILFPEIMNIYQIRQRFKNYFKLEEITEIHSKITKGEFYLNWQRIKSGEAKIIIGTRMAVFAPFKNLKLIIINEEQDISFKQWDMNPRYNARKVAEKLSEIHRAKLVLVSATPSMETYFEALNGEYKLLNPSLLAPNFSPLDVEIVDMRKERWVKNYSPISKLLRAEISWALKNKQKVILFVNRQGISAFSICESCKNVLRCPKCERALIYDLKGSHYCLHCSYESGVFTSCPRCKGMVFKNIGIGTQKIEKEMVKLFPGVSITRADSGSLKKQMELVELFDNFTTGKINILIGTERAIKGWDLPDIGLVGIIDADNLLAFPDFKTDEKAFQNIVQTAGRTVGTGKKISGKVIIQTFNPENFTIKAASIMKFESFYAREIEERKALKLPPFARLVKLIIRGPNKVRIEKEAEKIYNKIAAVKSNILGVTRPHFPLISKSRGLFRKQIIMKFPPDKDLPQVINKILKDLGSKWIIDIDPVCIV